MNYPVTEYSDLVDIDRAYSDILTDTDINLMFIIETTPPNKTYRFTAVNDTTCNALGYSVAEFLALSPKSILVDKSLMLQLKPGTKQATSTVDTHLLAKTGEKLAVELTLHVLHQQNRTISLVTGRYAVDRPESAYQQHLKSVADHALEMRHINSELQAEALARFKAEQALLETENQLRLITDHMSDVVAQLDITGEIGYVSSSCLTTLGLAPASLIGKTLFPLIHDDDLRRVLKAFEHTVTSGGTDQFEFRAKHAAGHWLWLEAVSKRILLETPKQVAIVTAFRDITSRKNIEKQLKYQAVRDPVTGLHNRTYFELEMVRLAENTTGPVGMIMCDLDGLKYVNDTLGHDVGDNLLFEVAELIRNCFSDKEIIARIGGDEFAVVLEGADENILNAALNRLKASVVTYNGNTPKIPVCLSTGMALTGPKLGIAGLFKAADNSMYREKLHSQQSSRSSVVQALKKALEVRDFVTEGHATRLKDLTVQLARMWGFPDYRLTDLRLFAEFHDIGKVGIPDNILFKPGPLSPEETAIMRSHTEIGHRIALASPDLEPIADWILKHHEWWNGGGYPLGLKGAAIPLECRILSIVDAYDAMTNDRPYRKALTHRAAITEIRKNAGSQFDPDLVKIFITMLKSLESSRLRLCP